VPPSCSGTGPHGLDPVRAPIPPSLRLILIYIYELNLSDERAAGQKSHPHPTLSLIRSLRSQGEGTLPPPVSLI